MMNLLYKAFSLEEVSHETLEVADLTLQVGALVTELGVALAKRLLLSEQHLDLGLFLLAVACSRVLVLLLLAGAAVVHGARVRLGARRGRPLLVGGGARGGGWRGPRGHAGAVTRRLRGRELSGAVPHQLLYGLKVAVVERGRNNGDRGRGGCDRPEFRRGDSLRLLRVAEQELGRWAGRALRRRQMRQLDSPVHGLELAQKLLGRLRRDVRCGDVNSHWRLHAFGRMRNVLEDGKLHLLFQPVGENVFCNQNKAFINIIQFGKSNMIFLEIVGEKDATMDHG